MKHKIISIVFCGLSLLLASPARAEKGEVVYHHRLENVRAKPYVDVLRTPEGRNILRDGPADHIHHHALMFAIKVDGINFWEEPNDGTHGRQVPIPESRRLETVDQKIDGASVSLIRDRFSLDWTHQDRILLRENRSIEVRSASPGEPTLLTWKSELVLPDGKKEATLGGNHYHGLGMRFDVSMDKNGRFFGDATGNVEEIRGDEKLTPCRWMAYTASLDGKPVTVALFDGPKNPRPMRAFTMGDSGKPFAYLSATENLHREPLKLQGNETISMIYGIAVWEGEVDFPTIRSCYEKWLETIP